MEIQKRRYLKLGIGFLILFFMGVSLAWSVFVVPIENHFGWTRGQTSLAFTMNGIFFALGSVAAGYVSKHVSFQHMLKIASVSIAFGFLLASRMSAIWQLYLGYGVLVGGGIGFGYNCVLSSVPVWFPEKSATATGMLLMGYALSTAVFGPILNLLIGSIGILKVFFFLAVVCGGGILIFGLFIRIPTLDELKALPQRDRASGKKTRNIITSDMVKKPIFWVYYLMTVFMPGIGVAMINHNSPVLTEALGNTASFAAMIVSAVALCNGLGRILFGFLFDRLGVKISVAAVSMMCVVSISGIFAGVLIRSTVLYIVSICLMLLCFGCNATMTPSVIREMFGHRTFSLNYSVLATYSIFSSLFPTFVGYLQTVSGDYILPLMILTGIAASNLLLLAAFLKLYGKLEKEYNEN